MNPAVQALVVVARDRRARRALLALAAGLLVGLFFLIVLLVSSVGALASMCQAESEESYDSPGTTPTGYVSDDPSEEALADVPADFLSLYQQAAEEYGLDWAVLAAVGKIETDHGRLAAPGVTGGENFAGAGGPMQFLASTWASMGVDGNGDGTSDRYDPEDAIPAAANYLQTSGAPQDYEGALYAYNHAQWYVDDVLAQAARYRSAEQQEEAPSTPVPAGGSTSSGASADVSGSSDGWQAPTGGTGKPPQGWDLVDDQRRIDYELDTAYASYFEAAAEAWNALGGVRLQPSPSPADTDLVVKDGSLGTQMGLTTSSGDLTVDSNLMASATDNARQGVFAHELGHARGLKHTTEESVMNTPIVTNSDANNASPTPYDAARNREAWGGSSVPQEAQEVPSGETTVGEADASSQELLGEAGAVFPLPEEHFDSYDDTWGAARTQGTHEGTDMMSPFGTPIYSITSGEVVPVSGSDSSGWNELGGWAVMVEADESVGPIRAGDTLYYVHQQEIEVEPGQHVEAGDVIGHVGDTGQGPPGTTGNFEPHLHLGWYDPTGARQQASSGAMNPYSLLEWLKGNGGTATGDSPTLSPSPGGDGLPPYCLAFRGIGILSGIADGIGNLLPGGSDAGEIPSQPLGGATAEELLANPNFSGSPDALADLENGVVDERLVSVLARITEEHSIYVSVFKTGHPYGATLPPEMGGVPNSHYYGLTADISEVDGKDVASAQTDPAVLDVGETLLSITQTERPDEIIGPTSWTEQLAVSREDGFVTDANYTEAHPDHLHIGWSP